MSQAKIRTAERLLATPGPFRVDALADPHTGTRVAELDPARARSVVAWYRQILSGSEPPAAPELQAERLALLDGWLTGATGQPVRSPGPTAEP
jgi:hypothetical protein